MKGNDKTDSQKANDAKTYHFSIGNQGKQRNHINPLKRDYTADDDNNTKRHPKI